MEAQRDAGNSTAGPLAVEIQPPNRRRERQSGGSSERSRRSRDTTRNMCRAPRSLQICGTTARVNDKQIVWYHRERMNESSERS